nr:hypothetical protein [Bacillaceae bacterium]
MDHCNKKQNERLAERKDLPFGRIGRPASVDHSRFLYWTFKEILFFLDHPFFFSKPAKGACRPLLPSRHSAYFLT